LFAKCPAEANAALRQIIDKIVVDEIKADGDIVGLAGPGQAHLFL